MVEWSLSCYGRSANATQQSIVSHLDALSAKVNQLKENYKSILTECDALKQALLREIFE